MYTWDFILSTYVFELGAALVGLCCFTRLSGHARALTVFMIWGFLVDNKNIVADKGSHLTIYFYYVLSEVLFLLWFLHELIQGKKIRWLILALLVLVPACWMYCHTGDRSLPNQATSLPQVFDLSSAGVIAFLSAYGLFSLTQRDGRLEANPEFWYLSGIFFYFMTGNFLFSFTEKTYVQSVWFIPRLIGIIYYLLLSIGFLTEAFGRDRIVRQATP